MGPVFRVRSKRFWRAKFPLRLSTKKRLEDRKRKNNAVLQALPFWCATATLNFWSRPASQLIVFAFYQGTCIHTEHGAQKWADHADRRSQQNIGFRLFLLHPMSLGSSEKCFPRGKSVVSCSVFLGVLLEGGLLFSAGQTLMERATKSPGLERS